MSKRVAFQRVTRLAAIAGALSLLGSIPAGAQTAAELRAQRDSVQRRYAEARLALEIAENSARATPDDSLLLHGSIVRFNSANLDERERRSLARAFDDAAAELTALFGASGTSLLEGQVWQVTVSTATARRRRAALGLDALTEGSRTASSSLNLPLNIPAVTAAIRRQAGLNLLRTKPRLLRATDMSFAIADPVATHYFAHRQLALHQSTPARRCARGNIPACADIFDPAARARWYADEDKANRERRPASGIVVESLLRHAVDADGAAVLRACQSAGGETLEPVAFLASALNESPDEFLRGWQAELAQSGAARVRSAPQTVIAAFGWFALCGILATRRRPK